MFSFFLKETADTPGTEGFRKFKKCLGKSATELKRKGIMKQARSLTSESEKVIKEFQSIIEKQRDALKTDLKFFIEMSLRNQRETWDEVFTEKAIEELIAEFANIVKKCDSEKEAVDKFQQSVNAKIKKAADKAMKRVMDEIWNQKPSHHLFPNSMLPYPQFDPQRDLPWKWNSIGMPILELLTKGAEAWAAESVPTPSAPVATAGR